MANHVVSAEIYVRPKDAFERLVSVDRFVQADCEESLRPPMPVQLRVKGRGQAVSVHTSVTAAEHSMTGRSWLWVDYCAGTAGLDEPFVELTVNADGSGVVTVHSDVRSKADGVLAGIKSLVPSRRPRLLFLRRLRFWLISGQWLANVVLAVAVAAAAAFVATQFGLHL